MRLLSLSRSPEPGGAAIDLDGDDPMLAQLGSNDHEFQDAGQSGANGPQDSTNSENRELEGIIPDPLVQEGEGEDANTSITLPKLQTTQAFVDLLRIATLDDSGMDSDDIFSLRNPEPGYHLVDPSQLLRSLRHFINNAYSSHDHYDEI
jgi:hypothetical protein